MADVPRYPIMLGSDARQTPLDTIILGDDHSNREALPLPVTPYPIYCLLICLTYATILVTSQDYVGGKLTLPFDCVESVRRLHD